MIEVDEIETDAWIARAGDIHLSSSESERSQRRLEQSATDGVEDRIDSFSRRQFENPLTKIFGLGIDERLRARNR